MLSQLSSLQANLKNDPEMLRATGNTAGQLLVDASSDLIERAVQGINSGDFDQATQDLEDAMSAAEKADAIGEAMMIYQGAGLASEALDPDTGHVAMGQMTNPGNVAGTLIKGGVGALTGGPIGDALNWLSGKLTGGKIRPITAVNRKIDEKVADPLSQTKFSQALEGAVSSGWRNTIGRATDLRATEDQTLYLGPDGNWYSDKKAVQQMRAVAQGLDPSKADEGFEPESQTVDGRPMKNVTGALSTLVDLVNPLGGWQRLIEGSPPEELLRTMSDEDKMKANQMADEIDRLNISDQEKEDRFRAEIETTFSDERGKSRAIYTDEATEAGRPAMGSTFYDDETGEPIDQAWIDNAMKFEQPIAIYGPNDSRDVGSEIVIDPRTEDGQYDTDSALHSLRSYADPAFFESKTSQGEQGAVGQAGTAGGSALPPNWSENPFFGNVFTSNDQTFVPGMNRWMYESPDNENWYYDQGANNWMYAHDDENTGKWLYGANENAWAHESNFMNNPYEQWNFSTRSQEEEKAQAQARELQQLSERVHEMASMRSESLADSVGERVGDRIADKQDSFSSKVGVVEFGDLEQVDDRMEDKMETLRERARMRFGG